MAPTAETAAAAAAAPITASRVEQSKITAAVTALLKHKAAAAATSDKLQLLPQDDYIYLNLTLKKIPTNPSTKPFKIPLTHPTLDPNSQVCLIIDDRPQTPTPPSDQIKKLIKSQCIPISKVVKLSKLKTNYKPFEAKRKLCDSFDMFLVDKRIVHFLPKLIGKEFFKKKKLPLGVDLGKKNLKAQVENALGSALLYLRSGTCSVTKVGRVDMEKDAIVENVLDAINGAVDRVSKKWDGVRSLHLKFSDSVALPVYQAMPDVKLKIEGLKESEKRAEVAAAKSGDHESVEVEGVVSGKTEGKSGKRKKGRMHEVRYMDVGEKEGDESEEKSEANLMEEVDDEVENKPKAKKRSKVKKDSKEDVLVVLNEEKLVKKKTKKPTKGEKTKDETMKSEKTKSKKASESVVKVKDGKSKKRGSAK
ncbi:hypothetical protein ABFX02_02G075700 [Erythranthe guttata]